MHPGHKLTGPKEEEEEEIEKTHTLCLATFSRKSCRL
jgi:hypothetical protein